MAFIPFPFDDDEKRRLALTPGINPNVPPNLPTPKRRPMLLGKPGIPGGIEPKVMPEAPEPSPLPELATPNPVPSPPAWPPGILPPPEINPESRYKELDDAKRVFLLGTPSRKRSALGGALRGAIQGLASGQGLGGAVGGALGGAISGGLNPRGMREQQFNEQIRPQILERFSYEDADRAAQAAAIKQATEQAMVRMQLANTQSQINERQAASDLNRDKFNYERSKPLIPKPPTEAELTIEPSSGKSFEQIAEESYQGRGGDKYVFDRLPERTRQLINGSIPDADPQEIESANRAFQGAIARERKAILDYTKGDVRSRAMGAKRGGGAKPLTSAASTGQRKATVRSDFIDFVAREMNVTPEKAKQMIEEDGYRLK